LIAANLPLTDAEAVKFWPVYDQYQAEITKIGDTRFALIKEYATNYNTLTDMQAHDLVTRMIGVDESLVQLRQKYIPIVEKVLPGKKTAMFFQMDRRVALMIDLQLASMIPIVQP
jgi:tryptophan 2,3-dioxygenase